MSMTIDKVKSDLKLLNELFADERAFLPSQRLAIYSVLNQLGIDVTKTKLISFLPEGDAICSVTLVNQHDELCFIDIDTKKDCALEVEKLLIDEYKETRAFKDLKYYTPLKVALCIEKK